MFKFAFGSALFLALMVPAQAYIDPGTGSMIIQGVFGAVAGGLLVVRSYWRRIKAHIAKMWRRGPAGR